MMSKFLLAAALAIFLPIKAQAQAVLNIVADEWPPFSGATLPNGGMSLDVISTVLKRAGYEVETSVIPWARIMSGAREGSHDIVGSLFYDAEMEEYLTYSAPFFQTEVKFVQKRGNDLRVGDLDSLRPFSIAVGDGFLYEDRFDRADYLNKIVVTTALQGVQMVAHGRSDLTLDSVEVIRYAIENGDPSIAEMVEFLPNVLTTHGIHMAVRNDLPGKEQLLADFNATLRAMEADGSLAQLLARHTSR